MPDSSPTLLDLANLTNQSPDSQFYNLEKTYKQKLKIYFQSGYHLTPSDSIQDWINSVYLKKIQNSLNTQKNEKNLVRTPLNNKMKNIKTKSSKKTKQDQKQEMSDEQNIFDEDEQKKNEIEKVSEFKSQKFWEYLSLVNKEIKTPIQPNQESFQMKVDFNREKINYIYNSFVKLLENGIKISKQPVLKQDISFKRISIHGDCEIANILVSLGPFSKNINVYHLTKASCFHSIKPIDQGSYGRIYQCDYQNKFVVKCIPRKISKININTYQTQQISRQQETFKIIIKEYMITYIAGILELGPKVLNPLGFDLVMSKNCAEFFIEKCQPPNINSNNYLKMQKQIKESLFHLHLLNFVHNDIKPENIMYSPSLKKLIFIDFGLSEYKIAPIGYKNRVKFLGTYQYCSREMQKLYLSNKSKFIDLHFNDAHGLNESFKTLLNLKIFSQKQEIQVQQIQKMTENSLYEIHIKYLIWIEDLANIVEKCLTANILKKNELKWQIKRFIRKMSLFPICNFNKIFYKSELWQSILVSHTEHQLDHDQNLLFEYNQLYVRLLTQKNNNSVSSNNSQTNMSIKTQANFYFKQQKKLPEYQKLSEIFLNYIQFLNNQEKVTIEQKSSLSLIFIQIFQIQNQFSATTQPPVPSIIQPILQCLYHMLKYCFTNEFNSWKRKNLCKILISISFLGWVIPKSVIISWRYFHISNCYNSEIPEDIFQNYFKFSSIFKIYEHRSFMFKNQKCVNQIETERKKWMKVTETDLDTNSQSLFKFYQEKQNYFNKIQIQKQIYDLLLDIFKLDQYEEANTNDNLNLMLKHIPTIKNSLHFQKDQTKAQIFYEVIVFIWQKIRKNCLENDEIVYIMNLYCESSRNKKKKEYRLHQLDFFFISLSQFSNNISAFLNHFDNAIYCPLISNSFGIAFRIMNCFLENNQDKLTQYLNQLKSMKIDIQNDFFLFINIASIFQNCLFILNFNQRNPHEIILFYCSIILFIDRYISQLYFDQSILHNRDHRKCFAQMVYILSIALPNSKNQQFFPDFESHKAIHLRLLRTSFQILQKNCDFNEQKANLYFLICSKIEIYKKTQEFNALDQQLQMHEVHKLEEKAICNMFRSQRLAYISFCAYKIFRDNKQQNREKMMNFYYKLTENRDFFYIFAKNQLIEEILDPRSPPQLIVHFFQSISQILQDLPSKQSVHRFYLFAKRAINKNKTQGVARLQQIYTKFDVQKRFLNTQKNAYTLMVAFTFARQLQYLELIKLNKKIVLIFPYLNRYAKNTIAIQHIGIWKAENPNMTSRKRHCIQNVLVRLCLNQDIFLKTTFIKILPPKHQYAQRNFKKGYFMFRKKEDKYLQNAQIQKQLHPKLKIRP